MPPIYKGRRDPEQEAYDKLLTRQSNRDAMEGAARAERAAFLAHIRGTPGELSVRNMMPSWDTYKNSPGVSGNSAMTDYILRYNAENPQRPFQPDVYLPPARPAARAVAPAAAPSRVMANAPAVGVQDIAKKNLTPDQMNERASAVQQSASGAQQPGPLDTLDETSARQRVLNRDFTTAKPDGRPDVVYGWAGYGGTGRQLVSVPRDERNGQAHSDARREFYRKHEQDRADAYAGTLQRGQTASPESLRAWNKANPFNSDMYERDARAYADAAVAPRPVAFNAPPTALNQAQGVAAGAPADAFNAMRMPDGSLAYARPGGSPTLTTGRSASATMPDGKVERTVFTRPSATPTTDAVTNAGLGLDAFRNMMPGAKLAMTAGAMGAGAANLAKQNPSMLAGANTVVSPTNNAAPPLSKLDAAKAVAKEIADEEQRKQAAITAEQDASNKGASNAAQAKALTPPGSIRRPRGELDGIPLERLPNANPDGSMPKASEETIRAMTPQGLGQNVNDDPNSPYRLLAASGSNPAAPQPITSAVKTEGAGAAGDLTLAGSRLYDRTEVSPMDALISPKVGYGANAPSAIASAQSYQAANPGIKFTNKVDDETLSAKYPIVNSNKEDTGAEADFDAYRKLITTYPEGRSTSAGNQDATIAHELLHGTQPRPMDTPSVIARAKEAIRTRNDTLANSSTDAEAGARLPRLNRAWVNAGNSFPQNTDDAAKIYSAFGIHPPGKPSTASPPQGWDQDPANRDIKDMIKSYRLMPKRKQREFYDKWLPQQPGLASRDRSNGFESAA